MSFFKSPAIRYDIKELAEAREQGTFVTSGTELFFYLCPAEIFAVAGSDGKTTTAIIIHRLLQEAGYTCWLGANTGAPLLGGMDEILPEHRVVLELSSLQLHTMAASPHVAVITNLSPVHLGIHKSIEEYVNAEKNIFRFQNPDDILVTNYDNHTTRSFGEEAPSKTIFFSRTRQLETGAFLKDGSLCFRENGNTELVIERKDIMLPGNHNVENFLAAIAATREYVTREAVRKAAAGIKGIPHMIEFVRELNGVCYYNDSIAGSPARTIATLNAFDRKVLLIAGGYGRNISYEPLGPVLAGKVKHLILIGQTASMIELALMANLRGKNAYNDIRITRCSTLEQAVYTAYFSAKKGDVVLLSPASASFGMFKNFEERGDKFKQLVNSL